MRDALSKKKKVHSVRDRFYVRINGGTYESLMYSKEANLLSLLSTILVLQNVSSGNLIFLGLRVGISHPRGDRWERHLKVTQPMATLRSVCFNT